jgi:hypothetical protein
MKILLNFLCTYLLSSFVSGSIFGLRVSVFIGDCLDGIHRLERIYKKRSKFNNTHLTADIREVLTLSARAKATSVKCGI